MHAVSPKIFPKALVFDWDNTLVDSQSATLEALNITLKTFGYTPLSREQYANQPSLSVRAYFEILFPLHQLEEAKSIYLREEKKTSSLGVVPFKEAAALLTWLDLHRIPMAVVSNKGGDLLREEVKQLGWNDYFFSVIGSCDTPEDKPSAVPLLHVLKQGSLTPSSLIWFVGDSIVDMKCAEEAACLPVSVGRQADLHASPVLKAQSCGGLHTILRQFHDSNPCFVPACPSAES
jgi:phosphoglycolate phosphatase